VSDLPDLPDATRWVPPHWWDDLVVAPVDALFARLAVGEGVDDPELCDPIAMGVDGLFLVVAPEQCAGWPAASTVDGTVVSWCSRPDADTLTVAGFTHVDFSTEGFPSRVDFRRGSDDQPLLTAIGYIGQVDPVTGAPPRLPSGSFLLPGPDGLELIAGRRQVPVTWTGAFSVSGSP
jgi:hypothetical protein